MILLCQLRGHEEEGPSNAVRSHLLHLDVSELQSLWQPNMLPAVPNAGTAEAGWSHLLQTQQHSSIFNTKESNRDKTGPGVLHPPHSRCMDCIPSLCWLDCAWTMSVATIWSIFYCWQVLAPKKLPEYFPPWRAELRSAFVGNFLHSHWNKGDLLVHFSICHT